MQQVVQMMVFILPNQLVSPIPAFSKIASSIMRILTRGVWGFSPSCRLQTLPQILLLLPFPPWTLRPDEKQTLKYLILETLLQGGREVYKFSTVFKGWYDFLNFDVSKLNVYVQNRQGFWKLWWWWCKPWYLQGWCRHCAGLHAQLSPSIELQPD